MILLNNSSVRKYKFDSLRYLSQVGGALAPVIQKEVANIFKPAKLFIMYGATEASARLSYLSPEMLPKKWGLIGKAIPNVDLFWRMKKVLSYHKEKLERLSQEAQILWWVIGMILKKLLK